MSSLSTHGPARRLLYGVCRQMQTPGVVVTARASASLVYGDYDASGQRGYATKRLTPNARKANPPPPRATVPPSSPASSRASRLPAKNTGLSSREPPRLIFSPQDIPPLQEWINSLDGLGNRDLTPLQCVDGARCYVSIATQHESQWRPQLEKEHNLSPYMLHWIGILLLSGNTAPRWRLGTHMLRSASELGFAPSTLSLIRIFVSMPSHMFDRAVNSLIYREANARFQKVIAKGLDPNALTLQGIIHAKRGDRASDMMALASFSQATEAWKKTKCEDGAVGEETESDGAGKDTQVPRATSQRAISSEAVVDAASSRDFTLPPPREPRWEWEVSCILGQANILAKDPSTTQAALRFFRVAALELDNPHAFFYLARLMGGPRDSPERRMYLLKAAISGETEACREIGELEALAAARDDLSKKERADHEKLSKEWLRLAEGEDLSAFIKAEVVDDGDS